MLHGLTELMVDEILLQAKEQARAERDEFVRVEHIEKIMPRLLMDF
jgi:hypothetical protein